MTLTLLNPVQEPIIKEFKQAPRLKTLKGKTLGIYNNKKLNAAKLLDYVAEALARDETFHLYRGEYHPHAVMEPGEWVGLEQCDAVILANGDCGACSSSGIANTIELEKRGIPTMLISTPPFADAVATMAALGGLEDLKWAIVEHPIGSATDSELRARARAAADQFRAVILASAEVEQASQPAFAAE